MPKKSTSRTQKQLVPENEDLHARLDEAEDTLRAIRRSEADALIVSGVGGEQLFTLEGADHSYRMLIEDMSEGALTMTAEGVILYANRRFAEMLRMPLEKVIGSTIYTWIAPDSQPILQSLLRKGVDEKRRDQLVLTATDGTLVPVYLSVSNMLIDEIPDFFCLVATDLTDQKRSDAIVASEKLARELLAASNQSRLALLSVIEDQKQAEESLRQRIAELEALHTISAALRTAQTRDQALPILLDETLAALETDSGTIWLYHPDSGDLRVAVNRPWFQQFGETSIKPGEDIPGTVFASGKAHISTEFARDPVARPPKVGGIPAGWGGACVPIRTDSETIGVLFVSVPLPRQITAPQMSLLHSLAGMAGASLHRMRLNEETLTRLGHLQSLHIIDQAIAASFDLPMTLRILLDQVTTQLKVDAADVLLLQPHTLMLEHAAGRGFRTRSTERAPLRLGESFAGRVALERCTVRLDNPPQSQEWPRFAAFWADEGFVAYCAVPLIAKGNVKGVLEIFHRAPFNARWDWVSFLETLAGQAAIAIENAQLFEHLQRSNLDLTLAYDATIEGWAHALDLRHKETQGHTQRVTASTLELARAMGLSEAELVQVRRGALLHDIGKMGVPDAILLKPGTLTDEDWVVMRKHPAFAHDMLAHITYLRPALDIPYCHHEKWDGTGYPQGLKGEQIPLAARLFAVVDVWDALKYDRHYRAAWPEGQVLEHIKAASGTHFDPKVVELFLKMLGSQEGTFTAKERKERKDNL
jgi:PAS domain S-box-containing protein/putative nucleotidyltransferase with HDIG domain